MPDTALPAIPDRGKLSPSVNKPVDAKKPWKKTPKHLLKERSQILGAVLLALVVGLVLFYKVIFPQTALFDSDKGVQLRTFLGDKAAEAKLEEKHLSGEARKMQKDSKLWLEKEEDGTRLLSDLKASNIDVAGMAAQLVLVTTKDEKRYHVIDNRGTYANELVKAAYVNPEAFTQLVALHKLTISEGSSGFGMNMLFPVYMAMILVFGVLFLLKEFRMSGGALSFTRSDIRFSDVIGAKEAKDALSDVVRYLKDPEAFTRLGGRAPRGVMMLGGPGVGKTLLAKALAGEAGVNFLAISGSDFSSKFYGAGIAKVRSLFKRARASAPCIVFIDEADGLGKRTDEGSPTGTEHNRILNRFLVEMDGFADNEGIMFIGATNLVQNIDEAMLREGRFDRRIEVAAPDREARAELFRFYGKKVKLAHDIDFDRLSRFTTGMSPATIEFVLASAATTAAKKGKSQVEQADLHEAIETARMGALNGTERAMSEQMRVRVAVHEVGHAVLAAVKGTGLVEKVTILPRGGALGVTLVTTPEDVKLLTRSEIQARICMLLGGRCAELQAFGEASSGAAQDLKEASKLALAMVGTMGLGDSGTLISVDALPPAMAQAYMPDVINQADQILRKQEEQARHVLTYNRSAVDALVQELLAQQTIDGSRVTELLSRQERNPHVNPAFYLPPPRPAQGSGMAAT